MTDLAKLYRFRFDDADRSKKMIIWEILCRDFFQALVGENKTILDLASGYGEFSNNIHAAHKFAVDLNPDAKSFLSQEVIFHQCPADDLSAISTGSIDVVFTSNFLEHLPSKDHLNKVFAEVLRVLKSGGKFIIMGPNIRYLASSYWDFYDHHLPLSDLSLQEGLIQSGFEIDTLKSKFLPYTTQSILPQSTFFVSTYLKFPFLWHFFGKQFLIIVRKPS